jgi:hypothetical protein
MSELVTVAEEQKTELEALMGKLREFAQPRSAYTIEKHVICAQETPEVQYKQVLDELWSRLNALQDVMDERELCELELEEMEVKAFQGVGGFSEPTGQPQGIAPTKIQKKRMELEVRKLRRKLVRIDYRLEGLTREIRILMDIKSRLPEFTWEQFENAQPSYWEKRLSNQWWLTHIAGGNYGNLDAILNLFTEVGGDRPQVGRLEDAARMMELPEGGRQRQIASSLAMTDKSGRCNG